MSLYLDTSCLLKMLFPEPETSRVLQLVAAEEHVVVSTLARLEALGHIHARTVGGLLPRRAAQAMRVRLDDVLGREPCALVRATLDAVDVAEAQVRSFPQNAYCATLDRLHLAVMQTLDIRRLLTNDGAQARAARGLGFSVVLPR